MQLRFFHGIAAACLALLGCVESHLCPPAYAPLYDRAGQADLRILTRPGDPRRGTHVVGSVAASKYVRVAASATGAFARSPVERRPPGGELADDLRSLTALAGELLVGAEKQHRSLWLGALVGGGYGASDIAYEDCTSVADGSLTCETWTQRSIQTRYLRVAGELYVGGRPIPALPMSLCTVALRLFRGAAAIPRGSRNFAGALP